MRSRRVLPQALVVVLLIGSVVTALAPAAHAKLTTRSFQMPSGNIHCHLQRSNNTLRCDIRSGLQPEPKKACDFDWVGLLLSRMHRAKPNCASDALPNPDPPVLQYGERWERRNRFCVAKRSGLYCHNASGYHFKLSRTDWDRWYRP